MSPAPVTLAFLLLYSALQIALGLWFARRVKAAGDFFVAGRRLSPLLLFSTVLAANIGAGTTVGATGLAWEEGLSAWWWNGSAGIGSLLLAFWIGPRIWREAKRHDFYTVGDFLEARYGPFMRGAVAALLWMATLSILAAQFVAVGTVLNVVADVPMAIGCIAGGLVMTTYFAAGGLLGSAWVNLLQLVILLGGLLIAVPLALAEAGGFDHIRSATSLSPDYFDIWRVAAPGSGWTLVALLTPAFIVSPGLLQKTYGAVDERTVRLGIGLNGVAQLMFAFVPAILGMSARVLYPDLSDPQLALPTILLHALPPLVGTFALAAILSAEISTCDTILFMLATSLSQDLYRRFVNPGANDRTILMVARGAAIAGGAAGVALAISSPRILDSLRIFYALLGVSLFVPIVAGLHLARVGAREGIAAVASGLAGTLIVHAATGGRGFGLWTPSNIGMVTAAMAFGVVWISRPRRLRH
ncbi:MAG: sodium:solute symporter family protein [Acidobacteria bacterium]|nr:sodium:solute symporter family protein [Acidobacteriota bacterium]